MIITGIRRTKSVPLKSIGKEDIRKLESALLVMSLYSAETLKALKNFTKSLQRNESLAL
jgi:predicted transcriptional regulator